MSGVPGYRLSDRGDLIGFGVVTNGTTETQENRNRKEDDSFVPPSPPKYPPPPTPKELSSPPKELPPPPSSQSQQISYTADQINRNKTANTESNHLPDPPPLQLYADRDIRSLDKNPIHKDIMSAAETFRGRREVYSVDDTLNSMQRGEPAADYKKVTDSIKPGIGIRHPVYDPDEMRRKKKTLVVNSEIRWSESKPLEKRNTYTVIPTSQLPLHIAEAQDSIKPRPKRAESVPERMGYKRIEDVPDVDTLANSIPTHDEEGNIIPEWKRKLLARNYRVKLCNQLQS